MLYFWLLAYWSPCTAHAVCISDINTGLVTILGDNDIQYLLQHHI